MFAFLQHLLPKRLLTTAFGDLANSEIPRLVTALTWLFHLVYRVDLSEAERTKLSEYKSFNDFFTRRLAEGARQVAGAVSSPADGRVASLGRIESGSLIQAKGVRYSLSKLLAGGDAARFEGGSFITIYLAPRDYHRVHAPVRAVLNQANYVPGKFFAVNPTTAAKRKDLFATNERLVMDFSDGDEPFACVMVGAMLVAGIGTVWRGETYQHGEQVVTRMRQEFAQGEELGWFEMGSTVILVFRRPVEFLVGEDDPVQMGQPIA